VESWHEVAVGTQDERAVHPVEHRVLDDFERTASIRLLFLWDPMPLATVLADDRTVAEPGNAARDARCFQSGPVRLVTLDAGLLHWVSPVLGRDCRVPPDSDQIFTLVDQVTVDQCAEVDSLVWEGRRIEPFQVRQAVVQVETIDIGDDATGHELGSQNDKRPPANGRPSKPGLPSEEGHERVRLGSPSYVRPGNRASFPFGRPLCLNRATGRSYSEIPEALPIEALTDRELKLMVAHSGPADSTEFDGNEPLVWHG